jgi:hypothetical protein
MRTLHLPHWHFSHWHFPIVHVPRVEYSHEDVAMLYLLLGLGITMFSVVAIYLYSAAL